MEPQQSLPDVVLGQTIGGRYKLARLIGDGRSGRVYEGKGIAEDGQTESLYAVKFLDQRYCAASQAVDEFFREAKVASLAHPTVVTMVDSGWHEGVPYIVMEHISGRPLTGAIEERGGKRDVPTSLRIVAEVAAVMASAHDSGMVHGGIRPSNIMVIGACDPTMARVKVLDFGIAKLETEMSQSQLTFTGAACYQAPEQA